MLLQLAASAASGVAAAVFPDAVAVAKTLNPKLCH